VYVQQIKGIISSGRIIGKLTKKSGIIYSVVGMLGCVKKLTRGVCYFCR
jgi:hypothetical protein